MVLAETTFTDNDSSTLQTGPYEIRASYIMPVMIAPPEPSLAFGIPSEEFTELIRALPTAGEEYQAISQEVHERLLHESLQEYRAIWRELAES